MQEALSRQVLLDTLTGLPEPAEAIKQNETHTSLDAFGISFLAATLG